VRCEKQLRIGRPATAKVQIGFFNRAFEAVKVLNTAREILQSTHADNGALLPPCQIQFFLCDLRSGGCYKLNMTPDNELLSRYAKARSEDAFAELVRRHVNLVYSAALRQVNGDAHLAQDVAQTVFTDLARKAGSLVRRGSLTGWLYTSAHFAAAKMARTENRRHHREDKFMREPISESALEVDWEKIRPALDDAMHKLKEADREAILLRYFENRQFAEVGTKLGLNENAARMRVERALEKLRAVFTKRGITTAAELVSVVSTNAVQMAPAGLAATLATTSIAAVGTGSAFTLMKFMTATHIKLGLSALVVAVAATALVVQHQTQTRLRDENESLHKKIAQLQTDNESLSNRLAAVGDARTLTDEQLNELLKLRGEVGILKNQLATAAKNQAQTTVHMDQANQPDDLLEQQKRMVRAKAGDAHIYVSAFMDYANSHNGQFSTNWDQIRDKYNNAPGLTGTNDFEIVYQGPLNWNTLGTNLGSIILIREYLAWPTYDGKWGKVYGFADGLSEPIILSDGNFTAWEQQHVVSSPNQ
jgi:RNA polymerase sigma factor (sigma-70 family)